MKRNPFIRNVFMAVGFLARKRGQAGVLLRDAQLWAYGLVGKTLQVLLYDDSGGALNNLIASSDVYTFTSYTGANQHLNLPLAGATLLAGQTYHLGAYMPQQGTGYDEGLATDAGNPIGIWEAQGNVSSPANFNESPPFQRQTWAMCIYVDYCQ